MTINHDGFFELSIGNQAEHSIGWILTKLNSKLDDF